MRELPSQLLQECFGSFLTHGTGMIPVDALDLLTEQIMT